MDRLEDVQWRAHTHEITREIGGKEMRGEFARVLALTAALANRKPPMAKPSNGISLKTAALSRRSFGNSAPCTMAKSAWFESPRAFKLRAAHRWVISRAARAVASSAVDWTH
jgi:hypothetical protein